MVASLLHTGLAVPMVLSIFPPRATKRKVNKMPIKVAKVNLLGVTRLPSSRNGNPRFALLTDSGTFKTATDSAISYEVENLDRARGRAEACGRMFPIRMALTRNGRVFDIGEGW